ncbi:putative protein NRT1/ PTR FAMILY 2.2 [Morella rubra]|uniref:Protein NRT1/ PTR FAMILY 2.3 n=1 Tax=Morella rubra TaxID=262757 RepID=A0A6A1VZ96_9ROSI|nr:putative protein NRT1/ PTR FAMILY 2.2 [Morella rubra]
METVEIQHFEGKLSQGGGSQAPEESKRGGWISFPFIAVSVMGLSIAAAGWASNLIVFLITEFNVKSITATKISNIVLACSSLFPIAGAIIADSFFSSFPVVAIFAFVSLLGMIMLTLTTTIHSLRPPRCAFGSSTCEAPTDLQYAVFYMTLALSSLGLGGTRFTIAAMGAEQFEKTKDQGTFFSWYYIILYGANVISFTAIIYIQDNVGWGLGSAICAIANAIGLAALVMGKQFYRQVKPKGSRFMGIARVVAAAIKKSRVSGTFGRQDYYSETNVILKDQEDSAPAKNFRYQLFDYT